MENRHLGWVLTASRRVRAGSLAAALTAWCWLGGAWAASPPDGWTLALSWAPGFCATSPRSEECASGAAPKLTLHGLWPEENSSSACRPAPPGRGRNWCDLPVPELSPETATVLRRAMPGVAVCLDRHEWQRHGVCSGLTPEAYFRVASENALRADGLAVASLLRARRGGTVSAVEIEAAMAQDIGQAALQALRLICTRRDRIAHLVELRFSLVPEGPRTFPRPEAFRPAGKGGRRCPANAIHVD